MLKEIKRLYFEEKMSTRQIAKNLRISTHTVGHELKKLGGARTIREGWKYRATPEYREKIRQTQLGEKNHQVKLTESDVLAIRQEYDLALQDGAQKTATQYYLAKKYGVKRPTISDIVLRKTWRHI